MYLFLNQLRHCDYPVLIRFIQKYKIITLTNKLYYNNLKAVLKIKLNNMCPRDFENVMSVSFGIYFIATTRPLNNKNLFHLRELHFMTCVFRGLKNIKL